MNKRIAFFNIVYYSVIILLMVQLMKDDSSSLAPMILLMIFWGVSLVFLIGLLVARKIRIKSFMDKIGVFMATPVIAIVFLMIIFPPQGQKSLCIEEYFEKNDNHQYLKKTCDDDSTGGVRVEYYLTFDSVNSETNSTREVLLKDSTWVYLSHKGDNVKTVKYMNGREVK